MSGLIELAVIVGSILTTSLYSLRQIDKVHTLVNSRLSLALQEIQDLRSVVSSQQTQLDDRP